jgi:hypothetical protein
MDDGSSKLPVLISRVRNELFNSRQGFGLGGPATDRGMGNIQIKQAENG